MIDFDLMIKDGFSTCHTASLTSKLKNSAMDLVKKCSKLMPHSTDLRVQTKEKELLDHYSNDVTYRLHYDSMSYHYVSPGVKELLGYDAEELCSRDLRALIKETRVIGDTKNQLSSYHDVEHHRKQNKICKWQADYLMEKKNGRAIWVSDVSYPWMDGAGNIIGSMGTLRDINDRVAAENRVRDELARLANTDSLTGLANRREYFQRLSGELKNLKPVKGNLSMLLIDIDHFKMVNDQFGHDSGDRILADVASILTQCLRGSDLAARVGGEEFGIILPETNSHGAYWVAERICKKIASHRFVVNKKETNSIHCTVSIGISSVDLDHSADAKELYKLADNRLYIAKNTGRNQVSADELFKPIITKMDA